MRKLTLGLFLCLSVVACCVGCGPKLNDQERNAPPPKGPHGESSPTGAASGGPEGTAPKSTAPANVPTSR